ncbi:DUF397 domain-containing protein [Streptomyces lasiicapitis]|uniref:DUF397 domain-containing protein n=1 Tax=Streptomyces lasiicapitis TaxID=1923961 RepID=UPI00331652E3
MASHDIDLSTTTWRKSSYSNGTGGECVEIADGLPDVVPVRDSKTTDGPAVVFPATAWTPFVTAVTKGDLSL